MPLNLQHTRQHLQAFDFRRLFIEELGWSNPPHALKAADAEAKGGVRFRRTPVAVLSGIHVFEITTPAGSIPSAKERAVIHTAVSVLAAENLLIFTDAARTQSLWYWVKREGGKSHPRDHLYVKGQPGDLFIGKLASLVVDISELDAQGNIPLTEVASRLKHALDVEKITKRFFREFDAQRLDFLTYLDDIADDRARRWYASVLLNRLMFIWFLQKKAFLDGGDRDYLTRKLAESRQRGKDRFFSEFLRCLFFEGFAKPATTRSESANQLLGKIRYLNGGLFLPHRIEQQHGYDADLTKKVKLRIPDEAFEKIFKLFSDYSWHLDDRPGEKDNEINPDVLGYIFEKYINQKEFGAYYTRPEITEYLCEQTIHRLVLDRINQQSPSHQFQSIGDLLLRLDASLCHRLLHEILPDLKLLDPACGSGAFLVAAMKTLINLYSGVVGRIEVLNDPALSQWLRETRAQHPSIAYYIKKRIITDNLFGVDIMEEATEIARLRLFLALVASAETEEQLEPLPNIDFNILAGNSLIGLLRVDAGKFDAGASKSGLAGDQSRMRLRHASALGFDVETTTAPTKAEKATAFVAQRNAERYVTILAQKNKAITLYRARAFTDGKRAGQTRDEDLTQLRAEIEDLRQQSYAQLNKMLLNEFEALGIKFEQATWDEKKHTEGKAEKRPLKLADIEALQPFHWGYEFDQVLHERGGFDAVIANPPWETFKPQDKEFFDNYSELVSKKMMTLKEFEKEQAKLLRDPEIKSAYLEFLSRFSHVTAFFRSAPQFKNQVAVIDGKKAGGDVNFYKLFLEESYRLLRPGGQCGIVMPGSFYKDLGAKQLREMLFSETQLAVLFGLANEKFIFEEVHHAQKFCIAIFSKGGSTESFQASFRINPREAISPEGLESFLHRADLHLTVPTQLVRTLSPDSLSLMEFKCQDDIVIAEKLQLFPSLGSESQNWPMVKFAREFDMTQKGGRTFVKTAPASGLASLYEGRMIWHFEHRYAEPRFWVNPARVREFLFKNADPRISADSYRLAFRRQSGDVNERTLVTTIVPPCIHADNMASLVTVSDDGKQLLTSELQLFLCAVLNSFVVDYSIRQRVSNNLSFFYLYQLPVPRLTAADTAFKPIVKRAAQLICTTPEYDALAQEVRSALRLPPSALSGVTDPAARARLRAELDGLIAHLYGLTETEFAHILTTFPLVPDAVKLSARNAYHDVELGLVK